MEGGCAYDGSESYRLERCYSSVELYGINPRGPIGGKSTSEAAVGQALCVEKYNTAIRVITASMLMLMIMNFRCNHSYLTRYLIFWVTGGVLHGCIHRVFSCVRHHRRDQAILLHGVIDLICKCHNHQSPMSL